MTLLITPFLWLSSSSSSVCVVSLLVCIDTRRVARYKSTWIMMIKSCERASEKPQNESQRPSLLDPSLMDSIKPFLIALTCIFSSFCCFLTTKSVSSLVLKFLNNLYNTVSNAFLKFWRMRPITLPIFRKSFTSSKKTTWLFSVVSLWWFSVAFYPLFHLSLCLYVLFPSKCVLRPFILMRSNEIVCHFPTAALPYFSHEFFFNVETFYFHFF